MLKWLNWNEKFYLDKEIKKPEKVRRMIDSRKITPGIYLLTLPANPKNIMELVSSVTLLQKNMRKLCPPIIGMAKGKDAAMELAAQIVEEVYEHTNQFHIEDYLENR